MTCSLMAMACGDGTITDGGDGGSQPGADARPGGAGGYFPAGSWMYEDVSAAPLHADSGQITGWLADNGGWGTGEFRIDFSIEVLEAGDAPYRTFTPNGDFYSPDCDEVEMPVPAGGALEGESGYECTNDGDCHLIVVDRRNDRLYEMWRANITGSTFSGGCLASWDMTRVYPAEGRGEQCTSADAAGFPIAPLLFSADEVAAAVAGTTEINHAIRFILPNSRMRAGYYVRPATHAGGPSASSQYAPTYGTRWRLKADFDMNRLPNDGARAVARALQRYGMVLADGGSIALTGQSDRYTAAKWDGLLGPRDLVGIEPGDFEVVDTGAPIELTYDCARTSY
jgi:serine/threonine-protein kinase